MLNYKLLLFIFILFFSFYIFNATLTQAEVYKIIPQASIPGSETFDVSEKAGEEKKIEATKDMIAQYIAAVYKYGVGITGILAFVMIMVGGIMWMMAGGSPDRVSNAKTYIAGALLGLILALSSYLLLQTVNPRLVNLEMPELPSIKGVNTKCCCYAEKDCKNVETDMECTNLGYKSEAGKNRKCTTEEIEKGCCIWSSPPLIGRTPLRCAEIKLKSECNNVGTNIYEWDAFYQGGDCPPNYDECKW